jgi:hypothetical protein
MSSLVEHALALLPGLVGIVAGYMMLRGTKYWTIVAVLASMPYLFYGAADITTKMLVDGEWHAVVSMFTFPLIDPRVSAVAKLSFVWFQAFLPLLAVTILALCVFAWFRVSQPVPIRSHDEA